MACMYWKMKRNTSRFIGFFLSIFLLTACDNTNTPLVVTENNPYARQLAQAQIAFDQQDYSQTILKCEQIIKYDQKNAAAYILRGQAYNVSGKYQDALNDFTKAIECAPDNVAVYVGLGWVNRYGFKQEQQAIEAFTKAVAIRTENYLGNLWRGQAYVELKQYLRAVESFTKSIALAPDNITKAEAYLQRGVVYLTFFQQYEQAIDDLTNTIELNPNNINAYVYKVKAYSIIGDYQESLNNSNELIERAPDRAVAYVDRAMTYDRLGNYQQAIADVTKAIDLAPDTSYYYFIRAIDYLWIEDFHRAEKDCEKSAEVDQASWVPHICSGLVHLGMPEEEKLRDAVEQFNILIHDHQYEDARTHVRLGIAKTLLNFPPDEIIAEYKKAIEFDPKYVRAYILLGERTEGETAIMYYSKAIQLEPEYSVPYLKRGQLLKAQGKIDDAIADFEQAKQWAIGVKWQEAAEDELQQIAAILPEQKQRQMSSDIMK